MAGKRYLLGNELENYGYVYDNSNAYGGHTLAWRSRKNISDLFHNTAVCLWITANATWMTGEFFYRDELRPYAMIFFSIGIVVVGFYYVIHFPKRNDIPQGAETEAAPRFLEEPNNMQLKPAR